MALVVRTQRPAHQTLLTASAFCIRWCTIWRPPHTLRPEAPCTLATTRLAHPSHRRWMLTTVLIASPMRTVCNLYVTSLVSVPRNVTSRQTGEDRLRSFILGNTVRMQDRNENGNCCYRNGMGTGFSATGAGLKLNGSGTGPGQMFVGMGWERYWKTGPVQYSSTDHDGSDWVEFD